MINIGYGILALILTEVVYSATVYKFKDNKSLELFGNLLMSTFFAGILTALIYYINQILNKYTSESFMILYIVGGVSLFIGVNIYLGKLISKRTKRR